MGLAPNFIPPNSFVFPFFFPTIIFNICAYGLLIYDLHVILCAIHDLQMLICFECLHMIYQELGPSIFREFQFWFFILMSLPPGFVLDKKNAGKEKYLDASEENSNCWEAHAKFQNIKYWNHDALPSKDDSFYRCFHWFSVSNAVSFS